MKIRTLALLLLAGLVALPLAAEEREREEEREGREPEPMYENFLRQFEWGTVRSAPFERVAPGAYANAVNQGQELRGKPPKVSGVAGTWKPVGVGPLIANNADYPQASGLGLVNVSGRLDSLDYDAVNGRLFATKGTGGVWMSTNLGDSWRSIGDKLPSQIVAAVAWTTAGGGRVLVLSGDPATGSLTFSGFGAFYSSDLGATWKKAAGLPDGAPGFALKVDPSNPSFVYAATLFGLYRSTDGGASYTNVRLPTGTCQWQEGQTKPTSQCYLGNVVTDVVIKAPGGYRDATTATAPAGSVLAVVGWRQGKKLNQDGSQQSPANGLYRSDTGAPGTFGPVGTNFAPQDRIGRTDLGNAVGALQDHNYVYAIVQDAVALNGGLELLDTPEGVVINDPRGTGPDLPLLGVPIGAAGGTVLQGIYVSRDFGLTWVQMADDALMSKNPAAGSSLVGLGSVIGYEPGVQSWYNIWIAPDPTSQTPDGIPTRLAFGLEEIWQNEITGQPLTGPATFKVIGRYFSGESCQLLSLDLATCPTDRPPAQSLTTHPDQHVGLWIPDGNGGVTLAVGNDGGFYRQHVAAGEELNNGGWGEGNQDGFHDLLPYDAAMAKDGTVYAGLQDNGHLKIHPDGKQYMIYGGDGTLAGVDPNDSNVAYEATPGAGIHVTTDGGASWREMDPPITNAKFFTPFELDPTDPNHLLTAGRQIVESVSGSNTGLEGSPWQVVYDMGTNQHPGDPVAVASADDPANVPSAIDVQGDAAYVAYCAPCNWVNQKVPFKRGLATNVGGLLPAQRMTPAGWHVAAMRGLPNRYIAALAIDPANPRVIYAGLGGYSVHWIPPGALNDPNQNIGTGHLFRSTDGGESFTDISGNLPDVPVTAIAVRGKQLILGTDIGVFTSDVRGGTTFAALGDLPAVPVSSLDLKPGTCNTLVAGTFGRGIYTFAFTEPLKGTNPCDVNVATSPLSSFHPAARIHSGAHAYWGGSQSYADSSVTRSLALPANASKLRFWAWYNLEDGYDWAYALISTDNGATWTSLVTTASNGSGTTPLDPIGTAANALGGSKKYPNGLTGTSGMPPTFSGQNEQLAPAYTEHTADLTLYAGRTVLLRFGYSSDAGTNLAGFYVDDVQVTDALGAKLLGDDLESNAAWTASGAPGFTWVTAAN